MLKVKLYSVLGFITVVAVVLMACTPETRGPVSTPVPTTPKTVQENQAIITDRTGREWDVTHARDVYDMNPDYFNYGLGIGAIPSVDDPTVGGEGDSGYPDPDSHTRVFGVSHNGEKRAYRVSALSRHEVFNDVYAGESNQYVAVAY